MGAALRVSSVLLLLLGLQVVPALAEGPAAPGVPAQSTAPTPAPASLTIEDIQKSYGKFEPRAVSAARHFYESPAMKDATTGAVKNMTAGLLSLIMRTNPTLSPQSREMASQIVVEAVTGQLDKLRALSVLNALQTFTTDELAALDGFYSSPIGAAVVAKMPQLTARMPTMVQAIVPDMQEFIRTRARAKGLELKI